MPVHYALGNPGRSMGPQIITKDLILIINARNQRFEISPQFFSNQLKALHHRLTNILTGGIHDKKSLAPVTTAAEHRIC